MEEAVSGVKGELAIKLYGDDLKVLEEKGDEVVSVMRRVAGVEDLGLFRVLGTAQPEHRGRPAAGGAPRHQCLRRARRHRNRNRRKSGQPGLTGRATLRLWWRVTRPPYRDTKEAIENIRLVSPAGERVALSQLAKIAVRDGASEIYREENSRYVAIKYSIRGRDLGSAVEEAMKSVGKQVKLPVGYHIDWAGEYESQKRSQKRLAIVVPITLIVIFIILYTMFASAKWAGLILGNVAIAPIGGLLALLITGTHLSVSSGVGFLALFGVSVQTGVIMLEYINQLRASGHTIEDSAIEGAVLRFRPILMTMLVATLGLLPAALSRGIGSDSQRPFAIVIVGGLLGALLLSIFLLPTLYVWVARDGDTLPATEAEFE